MSNWRPIETAPKDGTWVLLFGGRISYGWDGDEPPAVVSAQWTGYLNGSIAEPRWQFAWYDGGYYGTYDGPTHWMPMPEPPHGPTA